MIVFDSGDAPYFQWMEENPNGFVLNTERRENARQFTLHRSGCMHIKKSKGLILNSYTSHALIKIAGLTIVELLHFTKLEKPSFRGITKVCGKCKPPYEISYLKSSDELDSPAYYSEGAKKAIIVNSYERSSKARKACIKAKGVRCHCCDMKFSERYGKIGEGFIHVHHLNPLAGKDDSYEVDPFKDLVPVCPNCHAMLHKGDPLYSIEQLKDIMEQTSANMKT